ncbi:penicillin acylase family protein [Lentisalinibacter sediminis]|uniref:penicillin acylase family protein n=1 Tax=Lentisalinibacter sediminis TaxID=2992237 RepID=UPI0038687629
MLNRIGVPIATLVALVLALPALAKPVELPGLSQPAEIVRDEQGIAHIRARNRADLYYLQGWVHAGDRLFQMDLTRRQPSGTLAELLGPGTPSRPTSILEGDVEARTIGLRRAAERSVQVLSDETIAGLEAYARGVNDWVRLNDLPPEYSALGFDERSDFEEWTVVDSVVIGKAIAFSLSFDLDTGLTEDIAAYLQAFGPAGAALFSQDLFRSQPFDCASTVPDATGAYPFTPDPTLGPSDPFACPDATVDTVGRGKGKAAGKSKGKGKDKEARASAGARSAGPALSPALRQLSEKASQKLRRSGFIRERLDNDDTIGSNEWGVTRALGANGRPIIANDPHLSLNTPSTFYPIGLEAPGMNVFGSSFPGVAFVVLGHNKQVHWGATTNPMDVTDTFAVLLQLGPDGVPLGTLFQGELEPVELIPEIFEFNTPNPSTGRLTGELTTADPADGVVPPFTIIVPRRNHGPVVAVDTALTQEIAPDLAAEGRFIALAVQYTGFSATRELDTFRLWNEAKNLNQFREGLDYFDFGSQNWVYADNAGNVAYFSSAEMPLRRDLEAGTVAPGGFGPLFDPNTPVPPWFIRDGITGVHEWIPQEERPEAQAIPYEVLPYEEMPQTVNPPAGWFVNANNDPAGTVLDNNPLNQRRKGGQGIYYLNPGYAGGFRAGTITNRILEYIETQGELSQEDLKSIQADVSLLDAKFFVPYILAAYDNATAEGAHDSLAEVAEGLGDAVRYLASWNFTTPTGIRVGYDAGDPVGGALPEPDAEEVGNSVAATIYSVWRGQAIRGIVDAPLGDLPKPGSTQAVTSLQHLLRSGGGTSGVVEFFADDADRDYKLLAALRGALDLLASDEFAPAFGNSKDLDAYRWGKLHRIVLDHPFLGFASLPPQGSGFDQPVAGLPGYPTDGGFNVVDASSHSARADELNEFMFGSGPVRRFTSEPQGAFRSNAESVWAGGTSGVPFPGNPFYSNLLDYWLVNETLPLVLRAKDVEGGTRTRVVPARD